jgi:hypothetical protein
VASDDGAFVKKMRFKDKITLCETKLSAGRHLVFSERQRVPIDSILQVSGDKNIP